MFCIILFSIWVFSDEETVTLPLKSSLLKNLPNEDCTTLPPSHLEEEDTIEKNSSGIYGVSGISMDIPVISIFQDPATHFTKSGDIL